MAWKFYRFDFTSTGGYSEVPSASYQWGQDGWKRRVADAPVDLSDADGNIFVQYDNASTGGTDVKSASSGNLNDSTNTDINISSASVNFATTSQLGGIFDGGSSGGYYHSENAIVQNVRGSFGLTNAPPSVKLRADFNGSGSSGHMIAFLSYKMNIS